MYRSMPSARSENLPVATEVASKVLCLPISSGISDEDQTRVIEAIQASAG
jgi:dTDP-4-amino-4,6-dideoxygalactose transaminase